MTTNRMTKAQKLVDARVNAAYREVGDRVQVDIMDLPKVFAAARAAVADGVDDAELRTLMAAHLDVIRKN